MMELPKEIWGLLGLLLGAISTAMSMIVKGRKDSRDAEKAFRDELREELRETKEEVKKLRNDIEELQTERLILKRALDLRDGEIHLLQAQVSELQRISEPL